MLSALPADEVTTTTGHTTNLRRDASHCLVGLWGRRKRFILEASTSQCPHDEQILGRLGVTYRQGIDGTEWFDHFAELPMVCRRTHFLMYRKTIDEESALLARAARAVKASIIYQLNADSVLYAGKLPPPSDDLRGKVTLEGRLRGTWKLPLRSDPEPQAVDDWTDVMGAEEAEEHVLKGGSLCIEAPGRLRQVHPSAKVLGKAPRSR